MEKEICRALEAGVISVVVTLNFLIFKQLLEEVKIGLKYERLWSFFQQYGRSISDIRLLVPGKRKLQFWAKASSRGKCSNTFGLELIDQRRQDSKRVEPEGREMNFFFLIAKPHIRVIIKLSQLNQTSEKQIKNNLLELEYWQFGGLDHKQDELFLNLSCVQILYLGKKIKSQICQLSSAPFDILFILARCCTSPTRLAKIYIITPGIRKLQEIFKMLMGTEKPAMERWNSASYMTQKRIKKDDLREITLKKIKKIQKSFQNKVWQFDTLPELLKIQIYRNYFNIKYFFLSNHAASVPIFFIFQLFHEYYCLNQCYILFQLIVMSFTLFIFCFLPLLSLWPTLLIFSMSCILVYSSLSFLLSFFIRRASVNLKHKRDKLLNLLPLFVEYEHHKKIQNFINKLYLLQEGLTSLCATSTEAIVISTQMNVKKVLDKTKKIMYSLHSINPVKLVNLKGEQKLERQQILQYFQSMMKTIEKVIEEMQLNHRSAIIFEFHVTLKLNSLILLNQLQRLFTELQNQLKILQRESFNLDSLSSSHRKLICSLKQALLDPIENGNLLIQKIESCLLVIDQNAIEEQSKAEVERKEHMQNVTYLIGQQKNKEDENFSVEIPSRQQMTMDLRFNKDKFKLDLDSLFSKRLRQLERWRREEEQKKEKQKQMLQIQVKHDEELHEYEAQDIEDDEMLDREKKQGMD